MHTTKHHAGYHDGYTEDEPATGIVVTTLLSLLFHSPTEQALGVSADSGAILPGRSADDIFLFEGATAQVSEVGAESLTSAGTVLTQRIATGIRTTGASDLVTKLGCGAAPSDATSGWEADNNTFFDVTTESVIFLVVFRIRPGSATARTFGKFGATGYLVFIDNLGRVTITLDDGVKQNIRNNGTNHRSGVYAAMFVGRDIANTLGIAHSIEAASTAALAVTGNMTMALPFQLADPNGLAGDAQLVYLAKFTGTDAEGLGRDDLLAWWTHGSPPSEATITRSGNVWAIVDDDVTFGLRVAPTAPDRVATGYRAGLTDSFGMEVHPAVTNLAESDFSDAAWVKTNMTVAAQNAESPEGLNEATLLTATAPNATIHQDGTTVASTDYVFGTFIARSGGSDVACVARLRRTDTSAVLASVAFNATAQVTRPPVTAAAATTGTRWELEIVNDADAIYTWGPQTQVGTYLQGVAGPYSAAGAATSAPSVKVDNSGNAYLDSVRGELEITAIKDAAPTADEMLASVRGVGGDGDRVDVLIQANDTLRVQLYNSAGVLEGTATTAALTWTDEQVIRVRWNSVDPIAGYAQHMDVIANGVRTASDITAGWSPGAGGDFIHVGSAHDGSDPLSGLVASLSVFDQERDD